MSHVHGLEENIVQKATIPQMICRFKAIPFKISPDFFLYTDKLILKFKCKWKQPRIDDLEKQQSGRTHIFQFDAYYKGIIIKTVWFWPKDRHLDQWNGINNPEINPHLYNQLIFWQGWQEDSL